MIYYVDSRRGSDGNDGLSRQTAWRTTQAVNARCLCGGDEVLFRAGERYPGHLRPRREPDGGLIRFGAYGVGEMPELEAPDGDGIELCNFDRVELSGLSVTAPGGVRGIHICNTVGGAMTGIYIHDCRIRHVNDGRESFAYESGGIILAAVSPDKPGWFEDVRLEDNEITDVGRSGILHTNLWACRPKMWGFNDYDRDDGNWWPSRGLQVRGNYIDRTGGDGIVLLGTDGALIEWNTVYHVMTNPKPPCANAGIWPQSSNNCVIQYNEVGYCQKPEGCNDAQGFDVDLSCRNTLIQYNYSHDNGGGFLLLCEIPETTDADQYRGTVVRNNLSVNDGNVKGELIAMVGPVRGVLIENNTLYSSGNAERIVEVWTEDGTRQAKDVVLRNNLLVSNGRGCAFNLCNGENIVFENNLYWGAHRDIPAEDAGGVSFDPLLAQPGRSGDGRGVLPAYVPADGRLFSAAGTPERPASLDALGRDTGGRAYIGAFLPQVPDSAGIVHT